MFHILLLGHSGEKGSPGEIRTFPGDPGQKGEKGVSGNPGPEGETSLAVKTKMFISFILNQNTKQSDHVVTFNHYFFTL